MCCHVPNSKVAEATRMLEAIHAQEDHQAAAAKAAGDALRGKVSGRNQYGRLFDEVNAIC